jgi:hypothetical protein
MHSGFDTRYLTLEPPASGIDRVTTDSVAARTSRVSCCDSRASEPQRWDQEAKPDVGIGVVRSQGLGKPE